MALFHIILLALIQGITEFLPISSSGHLVLFHATIGGAGSAGAWDENILFDIAVHIGTLMAVCVYFWRDIWRLIRGAVLTLSFRFDGTDARLFQYVVLGSIPVIAAGFALYLWQPDFLRSLYTMAWATLVFGVILWVIDERSPDSRKLEQMGFKDALLVGLSQVLALIPGTSRSGITMIAGRALGYGRIEAARFSLLLSTTVISGAGVLSAKDVFESGDVALAGDVFLAMILSALAALGAIALMMKWLARATFKPFAIYRILLGAGLLIALYSGVLV